VVVKFVRLFHSPAGRLEDCCGHDFEGMDGDSPLELWERTQVSIEQPKAVHGGTHPAETGKKA